MLGNLHRICLPSVHHLKQREKVKTQPPVSLKVGPFQGNDWTPLTVQAIIDETVAAELRQVTPSNPPAQPVAVQPEKKKTDGDGELSSSRSDSSQGARRRAKHAERAHDLLTYQEAYEIIHGAAN